jgi:uncharacterized protein (TIGR03435 family)
MRQGSASRSLGGASRDVRRQKDSSEASWQSQLFKDDRRAPCDRQVAPASVGRERSAMKAVYLFLAIAGFLSVQAQRFDVASVKPCGPDSPSQQRMGGPGGSGSSPETMIVNCAKPATLVYLAYLVNGSDIDKPLAMWVGPSAGTQFTLGAEEPQRVRGGPNWVYTDRFSIEARAPGPTDMKIMRGPMLRALLEDRFRLRIHEATEEVGMWALTVSKGGPKLRRPLPGGCITVDPGKPIPKEIFEANSSKVVCGQRIGAEGQQGRTWRFGEQPIAELADALGLDLGVKVIDQTGLAGTFDFVLNYALDDNTTDLGHPRSEPAPASDGPSIFRAVQDQLGLTLVKTKGLRGFIVIDHIERPMPNGGRQ